MDKELARHHAARAREIARAMRALGDHLTSLKAAVEAWEDAAQRYEALANS
jgi:seryl-tRNA(Sec) selenium transferase